MSPIAQAAPDSSTEQQVNAEAAPGAPMRVRPFDVDYPYGPEAGEVYEMTGIHPHPEMFTKTCTQGPVGDVALESGGTQRVMLTAGHCVTGISDQGILMGQDVYAPVRGGYQRIGGTGLVRTVNVPGGYDSLATTARKARNSTDWGIVVLDPSTPADGAAASRDKFGANPSAPVPLTGVRDYPTVAPGQIRLDNFGQPLCKDGSMGARKCGYQLAYNSDTVWSWALDYKPGDSGGVNFDPSTGQIVGMTSMGIGPLGAAQRADRAIEEGYGIPDGQVNDKFTPAPPAESRADFVTGEEEKAEIEQYLVDNNPDVPEEAFTPPTAKEQFDGAVHAAGRDAGIIAGDAQTLAVSAGVALAAGNATPAEVGEAANRFGTIAGAYASAHADNIAAAGLNWALDELGYN
ncbi:hypothetical protein SAMN05444817_10176 [Corynebacterium appendicis CIP 107643]|uniref:Uncharacterized protein n=1 Tax=Corynebacterium appendicis CIP 107643 TaxID=1161099 RepID=A0A1N7IN01_9CORY|nr:hypothetical protein CAPP_01085 [Corynebacterium appendicis CIP 107643]SIS38422.1 hypothetical protein SAMN05444817_10176 [Corynebacterium appendicis CIP 107643]